MKPSVKRDTKRNQHNKGGWHDDSQNIKHRRDDLCLMFPGRRKAVKKQSGVQQANVNLATEKLSVTFDEKELSIEDIKKAVDDAGYKAVTEMVKRRSL